MHNVCAWPCIGLGQAMLHNITSKEIFMKKIAVFICLFVGSLFLANPVFAAWPDKTITLIVPMPAGGNVDIVARLIVPYLEEGLGQKVIIKNVVGTSGVIGSTEAAQAKPDGYTFFVAPIGPLTIQPKVRNTQYSIDSFDYLNILAIVPNFLMTLPKSPWKDFDDFLADAKANPGKYFYGSAGPATIPFFSTFAIAQEFDLDLIHMPDKSSVDTVRNMENGSVQLNADSASLMIQYGLTPLVYFGNERHPQFPDIPSLNEKNVSFDSSALRGITLIAAPKGVDPAINAKVHQVLSDMCENPEYIAALEKLGGTPGDSPQAEVNQFMLNSSKVYEGLIKEMGL